MVFDYAAGDYTISVDGSSTGPYAMSSTIDFSDADLRVTSPGFDTAFFDNYGIAAVPEPSCLVLLIGGALALLRRK